MKSLPSATTRRHRWFHSIAWLLLATLVTGCFGSPLGGDPGRGTDTFALQGIVVTPDGTPVPGAVVRVGDRETTSNEDGTFAFKDLPVQGDGMEIVVSAPGYEPATEVIYPSGSNLSVTIVLTPIGDTGGDGSDGGQGGDGGTGPGGGDGGGSGPEPEPEPEPEPVYRGTVEASVRLVNAGNAQVAAAAAVPRELLSSSAGRSVTRTTADVVPGEWIVQLDSDYPVQAINTMWADAGVRVIERLADNFYLVAAEEANASLETELRLAQLPNVVSVEPNKRVRPVAVPYAPNDTYFDRQWSLPLVSIPYAWNVTTGSRDVVVAVLDTGILPNHPDLQGVRIVSGRNFASDQSATNYTDDATSLSHGTMVAGIIGAMTNNGQGIAGINWSVSIMPVRVMSSRYGGTVAAVGQGIRWAVDNGAHVINMSLAWDATYNDTFVNQQIEYAVSKGVVLVAGAGNDSGRVTMPAAHPDVIAVGAVDRSKRLTWYSNYGPQVDVVAPGGDTRYSQANGILSTDIVSGRYTYSYQQGTSFAAPHVTGIVALMYSAGITDPNEIRELLRYTAEDLGAPGFDNYYGYGLVNAYAAVTGSDPVKARVGVASADGTRVWGPVNPVRIGQRAVARVEGVAPGRQTVFAWIDSVPDGVLGQGDFAGMAEVQVPEDGTVSADLVLAIWETLPAQDRARLAAWANR